MPIDIIQQDSSVGFGTEPNCLSDLLHNLLLADTASDIPVCAMEYDAGEVWSMLYKSLSEIFAR